MVKGARIRDGGPIFPARRIPQTIIVQWPFQKTATPSPDEVSHRTWVSKLMVLMRRKEGDNEL